MIVDFIHEVRWDCFLNVKPTKEFAFQNAPTKLIQKVNLFAWPLVAVKFLKVRMGLV